MLKKILLVIVVILFVIQLVPNNLPVNSINNPNDLLSNNLVPQDIETLFKNNCYDCHSNETVYPWYSYVAPVSFLVSRNIREGREHLNFSEWESLSKLDKAEALDDLIGEVEEGKMPIKAYFITHPKAELSEEDRNKITSWADEFAESIFEN
jgi:hypothetical protein